MSNFRKNNSNLFNFGPDEKNNILFGLSWVSDGIELLCGLLAKDRGATENPVSDLELNLSKGNWILLNKVLICR